jgi:hypothetical protein
VADFSSSALEFEARTQVFSANMSSALESAPKKFRAKFVHAIALAVGHAK